MAAIMTQNGDTIRVEWLTRWYARLFSLPFLAAGLYFLYYAALILKYDLGGQSRWADDWVGLAFCLGFALLIGLPGLVLATFRYFVELDRTLRRIVITRQFGPLKFERPRPLADFKFISITDDRDADSSFTTYDVNLCGGKGTTPIQFTSFTKREEANGFANELGTALHLPAKDYVGTEPDEDC